MTTILCLSSHKHADLAKHLSVILFLIVPLSASASFPSTDSGPKSNVPDDQFSGCVHGSKKYKVGEIFFDGCAYKCSCRESGLSECEERCPVFIDTIGYENCKWQTAPDDDCCTIPVCPNHATGDPNTPNIVSNIKNATTIEPEVADPAHENISQPMLEPFCISSSNDAYTVGQSWNEGTSCLPKSCKCLLHPNGSTVIDCEGGCATIPETAFRPTIECPKPELITPEDSCLCPYVVCSYPRNTIIPPPQLPEVFLNFGLHQREPHPAASDDTEHPYLTRIAVPNFADISKMRERCFHANRTYEAGQVFFDGCAYRCTCREGGLSECEERCPVFIDAIGYENCEWQTSPDDPCCTVPVCSNQTTSDLQHISVNNTGTTNEPDLPLVTRKNISHSTMESVEQKIPYTVYASTIEPQTILPKRNLTTSTTTTTTTTSTSTSTTTTEGPIMPVVIKNVTPTVEPNKRLYKFITSTELVSPVIVTSTLSPSARENQVNQFTSSTEAMMPSLVVTETNAAPSEPDQPQPTAHENISQPTHEPVCVSSSNDVYTAGQSWNEGTSCLPKSCECLLLPNGSTATDCRGGCAAIPDTAFRPTIECPKPKLVTPEDACLCPYVVCSHPRNTIIPPPRLPNTAPHNTSLHHHQPHRPPAHPPIEIVNLAPSTSSPRPSVPTQLFPDPALQDQKADCHLKTDELRPYYIALTVMALFAAVTSIAFLSLLCLILRYKSSAKAPITRSLSDQAYDNPTYKACDNERTGSNDRNHHHNNLNHRNHDPHHHHHHHLPQQIKLNGMNGAMIIGTAQV